MLNNKITWICFALLVLLQLWAPASMIWNREDVLKNGRSFKFRSAPVDPNDPFRGKYIVLNFRDESFKTANSQSWRNNETVYVELSSDSAGFAIIRNLFKQKPISGDIIKTTISYTGSDEKNEVHVNWPFNRFYMHEEKAYRAEQAYRESNTDSANITYALVKVKDGDAVLENVFINDKPIVSYIKNQ